MYCNICQQKEHGHMELCPEWKDDGQDGYMPPNEEYVVHENLWDWEEE